jgi:hypothetical protein
VLVLLLFTTLFGIFVARCGYLRVSSLGALRTLTCLSILLEERLSQIGFTQSQEARWSCDVIFLLRYWSVYSHQSSLWLLIGWFTYFIYLPTQLQRLVPCCMSPREPFKFVICLGFALSRCPLHIRLLRSLFPPHPCVSVSFVPHFIASLGNGAIELHNNQMNFDLTPL